MAQNAGVKFHIVCVSRNAAPWLPGCLDSIGAQRGQTFDACVVDDASDDGSADIIRAFCEERGWPCILNDERRGALFNQCAAIDRLAPAPDDVIVICDGDDRLAHDGVLARLAVEYADPAVILTYGSYRSEPHSPTCTLPSAYPPDVIATRSFRQFTATGGPLRWNHLRSFRAGPFLALDRDVQFKWPDDSWFSCCPDGAVMFPLLEMAGPNHRFIPDVLYVYGSENPASEWRIAGSEVDRTYARIFSLPMLPLWQPAPVADPYLPAEARRVILADYGRRYGLTVFVETGTNAGDTPWALMDQFERLYTIEIGRDLFHAARDRFVGTNVMCLHGDSATVLPAVLREIGETPALLWLDGHACSSNVAERGKQDSPIIEELEAVFATGVPHVVLVDDARLFKGMSHYGEWDWPEIGDVAMLAREHGYRFECADDIIRLEPT